jgi:phosphoglycolate phosphatase
LKYDYLVFDLDGTLSNPKDGITKSMNYALESHGFASEDVDLLATYIGPQIDTTFRAITKSADEDLILSMVAKYRERYSDIGFSENVLYEGIPEVLEQLSAVPNLTLGVCTSKRVDFAERILDMFELRHFFQFISGGDVGIAKWEQLKWLTEQGEINQNSLMIGDRYVDLTAAQKNGLDSAGVLWGYGSRAELQEHQPTHLLSEPSELLLGYS